RLHVEVAVDEVRGLVGVNRPFPVHDRMAAGLQDLHLGHPDGPQVVCGPLRRPAHVILVPGQSAHAWDSQEVQKLLYVSLPVLLKISVVLGHGLSSRSAMATHEVAPVWWTV